MFDSTSPEDAKYLSRALELARAGWGRVHPNPLVGCVLVKDGQVIAEGYHQEFGGRHAEVVALDAAGESARSSTAYVSLEPCNHYGKTPPCSRALVGAGIRRVVFGAPDPGRISGGGAESLRKAGVEVAGPLLTPREARIENPAFFRLHESSSPFVAIKLAITLDGKISAGPGMTTRITGSEATDEVHRLRAGFDGILVGSRTSQIDDPRLTVRGDVRPRVPPARIVLDESLKTTPEARLFREAASVPIVIFTREDAPEIGIRELEEAGAVVHPVRGYHEGLDLEAVMEVCWGTGLRSILCEGGGILASALVDQELAHRIYLFLAPRSLGSGGVPAFPGPFRPRAWEGWIPTLPGKKMGKDMMIVLDRGE